MRGAFRAGVDGQVHSAHVCGGLAGWRSPGQGEQEQAAGRGLGAASARRRDDATDALSVSGHGLARRSGGQVSRGQVARSPVQVGRGVAEGARRVEGVGVGRRFGGAESERALGRRHGDFAGRGTGVGPVAAWARGCGGAVQLERDVESRHRDADVYACVPGDHGYRLQESRPRLGRGFRGVRGRGREPASAAAPSSPAPSPAFLSPAFLSPAGRLRWRRRFRRRRRRRRGRR